MPILKPGVIQALTFFGQAMEEKLEEHADKGELWKEQPLSWLLDRLLEEVEELKVALIDCTPQNAMRECADVANFAMMIHDNLIRKMR